MSFTPGQLVGAVIGATIAIIFPPAGGLTFAYFSAAVSIGMSVGGIIDPPDGQVIKQEGSRLGDLNTQTAEWGTPIHRLFGTYKMSGNIIWALDLHETKHVEESGEGKGGGGTMTETTWYSYAGSWAVGFCEGEVSGIKKIWFDSVLVYDGTNYSGGLTYSNHTIYLGASDQEIDWYMQSKNSDTPAYRNLCYIVFNTIELENYGNRIPSVSVELSKSGQSSITLLRSYQTTNSGVLSAAPIYCGPIDGIRESCTLIDKTTDIRYDYYGDNTIRGLNYDAYHWTLYGNSYELNFMKKTTSEGLPYTILSTGEKIAYSYNTSCLYSYVPNPFYRNGRVFNYDISNGWFFELNQVPTYDSGTGFYYSSPEKLCRVPSSTWYAMDYRSGSLVKLIQGLSTTNDNITLGTNILARATNASNSVRIRTYSVDAPELLSDNSYSTSFSYIKVYCEIMDNDNEIFLVFHTSTDYAYHLAKIVNGIYIYVGGFYSKVIPDGDTGFHHYFKDGLMYQNGLNRDGTSSSGTDIFIVNDFSDNQITVGSVVSELLLRAGLEQSDFDVNEGTDSINGYVIPNPMDTRSAISTIISAYKFDLIESDSKLILKKRDPLNIVTSIPEDKVVDFVEIDRLQTVELSRAINIMYANKDNNYDTGLQSAFRNDSDTETTKTYQYPLAFSDDEAKQLTEIYLYTEWSERLEFKFSLPSEYVDLMPTNVIEIGSNGKVFTVRLTKIDLATNNQLNCEASLENLAIYESFAIGSDTGSIDYTVDISGPTNFELLDIPMLDNLYNKEGIYIAANGYFDGWNGCGIDKSIDSEVTYTTVGAMTSGTLLGNTLTTLSSGSTTVWDNNSLTVYIINGNLYSNSMESVLSGDYGYLLVGDEIIQYMDATDNSDGVFLLENLLRGRRGTEWAVDTHSIGERVVVLDSNIIFDTTASLNVNSYYKATTFGQFIEDSTAKYIVPEIVCLKPLSPSYLNGERDGSNNLTITWSRRSRDVTGYFKSLELFEEIESYEIYIVDADITYTSTAKQYVYSSAQQTTDGLTPGDPVSVIIYQMSATIGRGYGTEGIV